MSSPGPSETRYDLYFVLFGIPIRVHPLFWLVAVFLGMQVGDLFALLAWVLAVFIAILVHEMGHALVMRSFGYYPSITLYGLGGMTHYGMRTIGRRSPGTAGRIAITAAGPAAGFLFAGILGLVLVLLRKPVIVATGFPFGIYLFAQLDSPWMGQLVNYLFFVTIGWGILNLLPVLPLDGGQIVRELWTSVDPHWGAWRTVQLSFLVAVAIAVLAALQGSFFLAILFGYMAFVNYQALRGPWI